MFIRFMVVLAAAAVLQAQGQQPIRSGIDLIKLDVTVVDNDGRAVRDLRAEDFTVKVEGAARPVSFANFYGAEAEPTASAPASSPSSTTNVALPGRVIIFVVDLESLRAGTEKAVLDTTGQLIDSLGPNDSVGLLPIPGKTVDITKDRATVKASLTSLRGTFTTIPVRYTVSVTEADAFAKRDSITIGMVAQRECPARRSDIDCPRQVEVQAGQILFEANRRILNILTTLTNLNERLKPIEGPKSIVMLSAGLPFTDQGKTRFLDLQRRSAESGVSMFVVQVEQPENDAATLRSTSVAIPRSDLTLGLQNVAGVTGGEYYNAVSKATRVFGQIQTAIGNTYQLGIEARPEDLRGRPIRIDVQVKRRGLTVKSRKELILSNTATAPRLAKSPVDLLGVPTPNTELPFAASAFTVRGEEPDTLKVIVVLELLAGAAPGPPPDYAISIVNGKNEQVFNRSDKTAAADALSARAITGVQLPAGEYRLRTAVVDAAGRPGSIEMPLSVALRPAGPLQTSDLMVGRFTDQFVPAHHLPVGTPITALLELYATDPLQLNDIRVDLELHKENDPEVVAKAIATVAETELAGRRAAAGQIPTEGLAPGRYDVAAIVRKRGVPVSKVMRTIAIKVP